MLQVEYRLKLGQDEFVIKADVKDEKEFFEQMSFYSSLPKAAPGGSTDLKLSFRTTTKGHKYYSLVSEKEKKEFKFGQNLENNGGGLFPKGWSDLYQGDNEDQQSYGAAVGGAAIPQQTIGQATKAPQQFAPPQAPVFPNANFPGMVNPTNGPTASAPVQQSVTPAPMPTPAAMPTAPTPAVANVANNVLARFGINK